MKDRAMTVAAGNLWQNWATSSDEEWFDTLQEVPGVRIERILSRGHRSGNDHWYDQPQGEWVLVLSGAARLQIEGEAALRELAKGDWLWLPPHCRHRVAWTLPDEPTLWLAVHCFDGPGEGEN